MKNPLRTSGFTLIELSIVLVIIGLIVGGVLVGKDLILAAETRAIMSQMERYNVAVMTFKGKYNCIPGDCANATQLGLGTNGNGNNGVDALIDNGSGQYGTFRTSLSGPNRTYVATPGGGGAGIGNEGSRFWNHLSSSGMIQDSLSECLGNPCPIGTNIPELSNGQGGITAIMLNGRLLLRTGYTQTGSQNYAQYRIAALQGAQLYNIYTKLTSKPVSQTFGTVYPIGLDRGIKIIPVTGLISSTNNFYHSPNINNDDGTSCTAGGAFNFDQGYNCNMIWRLDGL